MGIQVTFDDRGLRRAMAEYAIRRNKSDADVVNKAMRFILPAAGRRVRDKTKHVNASKIRSQLTTQSNRVGRGKRNQQDRLKNTLAAAIVAGRMRKKAPHVFPSRNGADNIDKARIAEFYDRVNRFVNSRARSANYLRAGFIPAYRKFDIPNRVPGQNKFKGHSTGVKAKPSLRHVAEAFATNQREGAFKMAPRAFVEAVRDTRRMFLKWLKAGIEQDAKKSGFH